MFRPQVALVLGALLLALGFAVGVAPLSTSVAGKTYECGGVIQPGWLTSGAPRGPVAEVSGTREDELLAARAAAQCRPTMATAEWLTWGPLALGAMAVLLGWTAHRERASPATARPMSHAGR